MIGGECRTNLAEDEVEVLFKLGKVNRQTECRIAGRLAWQTIDECLPLLKYVKPSNVPAVLPAASLSPPSVRVRQHVCKVDDQFRVDESTKRSLTSSLKAGWICFGLGVAIAWFFPPAFIFYSVALIMAIVAMCTHQVSRGLILLLSSFVAMGTSAFLSMILAFGLFAAGMKPVIDEAQRTEKDMQTRMQRLQATTARTMQQSIAPSSRPTMRSAEPAPPVVGYPPESLSRRDLMDEITSIEAKQRQLRRSGRDLDQLTDEYLTSLRAELDKRSGR